MNIAKTYKKLLALPLFVLCIFVLAKLSSLLNIPGEFLSLIWLPAGAGLAAVIYGGKRYLYAVFIAFLLLYAYEFKAYLGGEFAQSSSYIAIITLSAMMTFQSWFGACLLSKKGIMQSGLTQVREMLLIYLFGAFLSPVASAAIFSAMTYLALLPFEFSWRVSGIWLLGNSLGVVLIAPLVIILINPQIRSIRKMTVAVPTALLVAFTIVVFLNAKHDIVTSRQAEVNAVSEEATAEIEKNIQTFLNILVANEGFINGSNYVSYDEFDTFAGRFFGLYPGMSALIWSRKVTHDAREAFEKEIRDQGFEGFIIKDRIAPGKLREAPERNVYFPTTYVIPYESNVNAHGFDTYGPDQVAGNIRRETLQKAANEARTLATGKLNLVQSDGKEGLIVYRPVYDDLLFETTIEERQEKLTGYVGVVFLMKDLIRPAIRLLSKTNVLLTVRDYDAPEGSQLLYSSQPVHEEQPLAHSQQKKDINVVSIINFAGKKWQLQFAHKEGAIGAYELAHAWYILFGGIIFAMSLGVILYTLSAHFEQGGQEGAHEENAEYLLILPVISAVIIIALTLALWSDFRQREQVAKENLLKEQGEFLKYGVQSLAKKSFGAIRQLAERLERNKGIEESAWAVNTRQYFNDDRALKSISWINKNYNIERSAVADGSEMLIGLDVTKDVSNNVSLGILSKNRKLSVSPPHDLATGGKGIFVYVPLYVEGTFDGFLAGLYEVTPIFQELIPASFEALFNLRILQENDEIYSRANTDKSSELVFKEVIPLYNSDWLVEIWPKDTFFEQGGAALSATVLFAGLMFALFISIAVYFALVSRLRSQMLLQQTVKLAKSEEEYRSVFENAVDGLLILSKKGTIEQFNPACERIFGYKEEEVFGESLEKLLSDTENKDNDSNVLNFFAKTDKKLIGVNHEVMAIRKSGESFPMNISFSEVKVGDTTHFSGILRDVTEENRMEEEREELVGRLVESNDELEKFAYIASHDLQEPIRMVGSFTELLQKKYDDKLDDEGRHYISVAQDAAQRMKALVNDLLEYSRVTHANEVELEEFDVNNIMIQLTDLLAETIAEKGAKVDWDTMPTLRGNPVRFLRLMQNLINNGLKYQEAGKKPKVHISAQEEEDHWLIAVKDNGIGMKQEYCEQIFTPFKRLHRRTEYEGTGIGLAICKKIVEMAGGKIWAESKPGKGSTFFFTHPKHAEDEAATKATKKA